MRYSHTAVGISDVDLGGRVTRWRVKRGLTQVQLARLIGLDQSILSRIENGRRRVSTTELAELAAVLKIDPLELLEETPLSEAVVVAARGAVTDVEADVDAIRLAIEILRTWRSVAADGFEPRLGRRPKMPRLSSNDVAAGNRAANFVREHLGLSTEPLGDMSALAASLGLAVVLRHFDGDFDGVCVADGPRATAILNSNHWGSRQRFTTAHEIAHWILGDVDGGPCSDIDVFRPSNARERRANAFAATFLVPDEALAHLHEFASAISLGFEYGVSLKTLGWRIENVLHETELAEHLRNIEPWRASELVGCEEAYERDGGARFREGMSFQLEVAFRKAAAAGAISERHLAALLPSLGEESGESEPLT